MRFKRACLSKPGKFVMLEVEEVPAADEIQFKVASCGLCNWELNHWKGYITSGGYPMKVGHEYAGEVVAVGSDVKNFKPGDKVSALAGRGGFAELVTCAASKAMKLSDDIDPRYVLGEPLKCIVTVLEAAAPKAGDYGVVLGCGPMGQWCIQGLSGNLLAGLIAVDIDDKKLEMASRFGATHTINSKRENVQQRLLEITAGHMADFVIEGTGIPALLDAAQDWLRPTGRGRLILMSAYETGPSSFDFRKAIAKSIDLHVPHPGHSLDQMDDMRRAIALVNRGTFRVKELVSHEYKLSEITKAFEDLENKPAGFLKGIVVPD
jgi:threonine dehydrogenase-like Zn-dependent dehydrogenase